MKPEDVQLVFQLIVVFLLFAGVCFFGIRHLFLNSWRNRNENKIYDIDELPKKECEDC